MNEEIWKKFNDLRGQISFQGYIDDRKLGFLEKIYGEEKVLSLIDNENDISILSSIESILPPKHVYDFIKSIINEKSYKTILDPWIDIFSPAIYLDPKVLYGITLNSSKFETLSKCIYENIILGEPLEILSNDKKFYDLIISFPPLKYHNYNSIKKLVHKDFTVSLIMECSQNINDNGEMIFLVPNSFFLDNKVKVLLKENGLFVDALFTLPSGSLKPLTNLQTNLVVISKHKVDKIFVAELSETNNKTILKNYKQRRSGKMIQLGFLTEFSSYKSMKTLILENEIDTIAKRLGIPEYSLSEISEISNINRDDESILDENLNTIYFPKRGLSSVVSSISNMNMKPSGYFQIKFDESIANSVYVCNFFNSTLGKKIRESISVGDIIPNITKNMINNCKVYLPDLDKQNKVIEIDSKIEHFNMRLFDLKRDLWKKPLKSEQINKDLMTLNHDDNLEKWIDKLPFPISSILWRYYATTDESKKIEHLFHFFEAFSEFLAMIMLSALVQDKEFYADNCRHWLDSDEKFNNWYYRATFGNWNILTSKLSKFIRTYIEKKENLEHCSKLFGYPDSSFLEMLANKKLINILFEVSKLRNKWKGHGGITSNAENHQRLLVLSKSLDDFRKFISDVFETSTVIAPITSSFEDGVFTFKTKELIGARTPFNEIEVNSVIPLDRKKLYLLHSGQNNPIELLPFIKFIEESDAIYFYTSLESKDVRWVSYHFDKKSEMKQPVDESLFKAFDILRM